MNWYCFIAAFVWFFGVEFVRGRPNGPSGWLNVALLFLAPIGGIVFLVLALVF